MNAWRVLRDGAMLVTVDPASARAVGSLGETLTRTYPKGHVLSAPLAPDLVERWEAGDPHLRAIVERVEPLSESAA